MFAQMRSERLTLMKVTLRTCYQMDKGNSLMTMENTTLVLLKMENSMDKAPLITRMVKFS